MGEDQMEAAVVDAGSRLLKAGPAVPDQAPSMVIIKHLLLASYSLLGCSEFFLLGFGEWKSLKFGELYFLYYCLM